MGKIRVDWLVFVSFFSLIFLGVNFNNSLIILFVNRMIIGLIWVKLFIYVLMVMFRVIEEAIVFCFMD